MKKHNDNLFDYYQVEGHIIKSKHDKQTKFSVAMHSRS